MLVIIDVILLCVFLLLLGHVHGRDGVIVSSVSYFGPYMGFENVVLHWHYGCVCQSV